MEFAAAIEIVIATRQSHPMMLHQNLNNLYCSPTMYHVKIVVRQSRSSVHAKPYGMNERVRLHSLVLWLEFLP
jgi:hypothetical protein